ncbi:cytochrome P450 71A1-like isoform X2 [Lolium rigidum]|uniref:cytochrome P450 71A1-like isoform X2 n=1 Tax=Lolium rigidum TaxID=89674 RepID=UPI001F5E23D2|nr:cytochrome P450 71A1-like isoform X2 [Lolium rigidum]
MDASSLFAVRHSPLFLLVLFLLVPLFSVLILFSSKRNKKLLTPSSNGGQKLPPSPPGLPILGHLHLLGSLPHRNLRSLAEAHGPVMLLRLGRVPTVVASSAAAAQEVMKTRDLAYASRAHMLMADKLLYGQDMVLAPYGEYWRQARRVCVVHLLNPRRIRSFRRVREQEVAALLGLVRRSPPGGAVNLSDVITSYSNAVIRRAAFGDGEYGLDGDEGGEKLRKVLDDFEHLLGTATVGEFVPWLAWLDTLAGVNAKATRTFQALDGLLDRVIAVHRQRRLAGGRPVGDDGEDDRRDFVDVLLDVNESGEEAGGVHFDEIRIKAIMLDMFAAATDTTYTALEWAMADLINHPLEMHKLQDEIRAAVNGANHVNEDHLEQLRYLRAVIKESLRLHAPLPLLLPRETLEDTELLGYRVPARTRVVINAWAIGRDPLTWERADEFFPERFMDDPTEYGVVQDFSFVPFGAGRRGCPGAGFAAPSMELALASLLYHFDWELPNGTSKVDMREQFGISVRLKAPLHLVAKPWSP